MACGRSSPAFSSSSPVRTGAVASGAAAMDALAWLALVRASTSAVSLRRLIDNQGSAAAAMAAGASAWRAAGLSDASIQALRQPDADEIARDRTWLAKAPNHVVGWDEDRKSTRLNSSH